METPTPPNPPKQLFLKFHGRVLEHLGIQMYQSPVNAIAELVANAWDADATEVAIQLPTQVAPGEVVVVKDNGRGMTFDECQAHFLKVGRNRRGANVNEVTEGRGRPVLGRKGIGKFAGFGIARLVTVETVSEVDGERTLFQLELSELLSDEYEYGGQEITVLAYEAPDAARRAQHGTTVTLHDLTMKRARTPESFANSMARRFLLLQQQADFAVTVNSFPLPDGAEITGVQYAFPADYKESEKPDGLTVDSDGWGSELLSNGKQIRWRFQFLNDTIDEEELRGVAIFVKVKLGQSPFLFNLTKGLRGQHGIEYLAGQVQADYIDELPEDLIATERQRINWEHDETTPLLAWGQERLKQLLSIWAERRGEERTRLLDERLEGFAERLQRLGGYEARTVKQALTQLAKIPTLSDKQFQELGGAMLTAWESGRLRTLIQEVADAQDLTEEKLLRILAEADVLSALNTAEAVKAKLNAIRGLRARIEARQLENAVRDYIAENPWMISPRWDTFKVERGLEGLLREVAEESRWLQEEVYNGRVDLVLSSGSQLLILEFMRPGLTIDWDHISRFERYMRSVRARIEGNSAGRFREVSGYLVADRITRTADVAGKIASMKGEGMFALDWQMLLSEAGAQWQEFLTAIGERHPGDLRLQDVVGTEPAAAQQAEAADRGDGTSTTDESVTPPAEEPGGPPSRRPVPGAS